MITEENTHFNVRKKRGIKGEDIHKHTQKIQINILSMQAHA